MRATLELTEMFGIRRGTMADVARRSGVGRATLYRRFPTKTALHDAVVLSEARRFMEAARRRTRVAAPSRTAWSTAPSSA